MLSTSKSSTADGLKNFAKVPFGGERSKWEFYNRYLKTAIKVHPDIPADWKGYLFTIYPREQLPDNAIGDYIIPDQFQLRQVPVVVGLAASMEAQRTRNEAIRREKDHNKEVGKAISLHTGIISASCSDSLNEIFMDRNAMDPYLFYRYLQTTYGPESNVNEDKSCTMHQLLQAKMKHLESFDSFLVTFQSKATYLGLNDDAKRGFITATLANTDGKVQLLADRLIPELKSIREHDLNYEGTIDWLKRQDIRQSNDGLLKPKAIKRIEKQVKKDVKDKDSDDGKRTNYKKDWIKDGEGRYLRPSFICLNCNNYGHYTQDCRTPFCCGCVKNKPNHTWCNCPKKSSDHKGRKQPRNELSSGTPNKRGQSSDNKKVKFKSSIKQVTYEDTEEEDSLREDLYSEVESVGEHDEEGEDVDEEEPRTSRRVNKVFKKNRLRVIKLYQGQVRKISSNVPVRALIDSGAQIHATRKRSFLSHITEIFDDDSDQSIRLAGASGEDLGATAIGYINGLDSQVVVAKVQDDILISTSQLNLSGYWVFHMPHGLIPGVGALVIDGHGRIIMVADEEMYTNPQDWYKYNVTVDLPKWGSLLQYLRADPDQSNVHVESFTDQPQINRILNINRIIGMEKFSVKQKVMFQQRVWFAPMNMMIWHAEHVIGYPLTVHQIKEHFDHSETAKIRGHMESTRFSYKFHSDQSENKEIEEYFKSLNPKVKAPEITSERTEPRNITIGKETGSDIACGPGNFKAVFIDKASNHKWSMTIDTKDHLPDAFLEYTRFMKSYGHVLQHLRSDDEAVYKTPAMKAILKENNMTASQSAPSMKQWNGLAESSIKKTKSVVTSMLSISKHLTESFWIKAWELSDLLHSLGPCPIVGKGHITKFEAVRKTPPDMNAIILLPFGQPVEFHIPKAERGTFHEKSRAGSYVGASLDHPGAIQVWSHNTRRIITTASFKVKHVIPNPDITFDRSVFCDPEDKDTSPVSDLRDPTNLPGAMTRRRTKDADRIALEDNFTLIDESIAPINESVPSQEGAITINSSAPPSLGESVTVPPPRLKRVRYQLEATRRHY